MEISHPGILFLVASHTAADIVVLYMGTILCWVLYQLRPCRRGFSFPFSCSTHIFTAKMIATPSVGCPLNIGRADSWFRIPPNGPLFSTFLCGIHSHVHRDLALGNIRHLPVSRRDSCQILGREFIATRCVWIRD